MARRCLALLIAAVVIPAPADRSELQATVKSRQLSSDADWSEQLAIPQPKVVEYKSPIKRVLELLRRMKAELEQEGKDDAELYAKMVCWCEKSEKEKKKAIDDANTKDKSLSADISSRTARASSLTTAMQGLKDELSELKESMEQARALRDKEEKAFFGEENALTQALTNVNNAIVILSKHHSFVQIEAPLMMGIKTVLRDVALQHELLTGSAASQRRSVGLRNAFISLGSDSERASLRQSQRMNRELLKALDVQAAGDDTLPLKYAEHMLKDSANVQPFDISFLQIDKPPSYTSQSGVVFGMLKQMKADFEEALRKARTDESKAVSDYKDLVQSKQAQIDASDEKLDDLADEKSQNSKALSDAKEDLEMTRDQRSADSKFLANVKKTCQDLDGQWKVRSKTRSDELTAVSEALAILTKEDARDLLRDSVKFLQLRSMTHAASSRRSQAAKVLRGAFDGADALLSAWESRHGEPPVHTVADPLSSSHTALAALTVSVRLDSFTKVKASIDKLVAVMKQQQTAEAEFKAKCNSKFRDIEKNTLKKNNEREDLEASLKELAAQMEALDKERSDAKAEIADTELEVKKAGQDREAANAQYQSTIKDQRATQDILKKALAKLSGFYKKKALLQMRVAQTPPGQFATYRNNAGASPVIGMIEQIVEDSKKLETDSIAGEKASQAEYEKFVKDANALIDKLTKVVTEKTKAIAAAKSKSADAKGDLQSTNKILEGLAKVEGDLHEECDFVLKNYAIRQKARATEIEALSSAKAVLSGATISGGIRS